MFDRGTLSAEAEWGGKLAIRPFKAFLILPDVTGAAHNTEP